MYVKIDGEYEPTPDDISKCLWNEFDAKDLAEFITRILFIRNTYYLDFLLQLDYISEELTNYEYLSDKNIKDEIINLCDELKEHLTVEFEKENE